MLGLVAVAENRHGQSDGQNPFEIDSLRPLATATASARGSQNRFKMITLTLFMPTFGSSCPYSHLSSKLLTHLFLWKMESIELAFHVELSKITVGQVLDLIMKMKER